MDATREELARRIDVALGRAPADLVVRGGEVLDVAGGRVRRADVAIVGGFIAGVGEGYRGREALDARGRTVVPGFVDAHVHVESSLVGPLGFDRCVLPRGTTTAVCDPHEIANVLGADGVSWMLGGASRCAMDLFVMLPSCVPATHLETAGAALSAEDLGAFRDHPLVLGLAEVMNVPGVLGKDDEVLAKLAAFSDLRLDGHMPLVSGPALDALAAAGIRTDHETTGLAEAREKLARGIRVLIREGSVSKEAAALAPLLDARTAPFLALCTDDRNPLDISEEGHLDHIARVLLAGGADPVDVYRAASWSGARAFGLRDRGLVAPGYRADLVVLADRAECRVETVVKNGRQVCGEMFESREAPAPVGLDSVRLDPVTADDFRVRGSGRDFPVIGVAAGTLLTEHLRLDLAESGGEVRGDPSRDVLRVAVLERHRRTGNVGRGFVRGFGLRAGALASSVGHDSHNVCVVGADPADMAAAVNRLIGTGGGFVVAAGGEVRAELPLPIAGLLSEAAPEEVCAALRRLRAAARELGCALPEPLLALAFLPLPVIPALRLTDLGIVDVERFAVIRN